MEKLAGTGIDVQGVSPNDIPMYRWSSGCIRQGTNWKKRAGYTLAVMFQGIDPRVLYGDAAKQFLARIGFLSALQPVIDSFKKLFPDGELAVCMDNGPEVE